MMQAKQGDTVRVHYTGKLDDGTVFDTSTGNAPLEFTIGRGELIRGFEEGVVGMSPGEEKTVRVSSEEAYGPHREELVISVDKAQLPEGLEPCVGQMLEGRRPDGQSMAYQVAEVSESSVTLDGNHPLAGLDLLFTLQLVEMDVV
jgi:peptidylprolyl isomerase